MSKKQESQGAGPQPVRFNFSAVEERTETIALEGFQPFDITFRVPSAVGMADLGMESTPSSSDEVLASRGEAMLRFSARHLKKWSLPHAPDYRSLSALQDVTVLFAIFSTIAKAGRAAKNS